MVTAPILAPIQWSLYSDLWLCEALLDTDTVASSASATHHSSDSTSFLFLNEDDLHAYVGHAVYLSKVLL